MGGFAEKKKRRKRKPKPLDPEEVDEHLRLRYTWLLIEEMEFHRKLRLKAVRLSRKYRKQPWVI